MKLLFDQNLSFKLCARLSDLFPNSSQVRVLGLDRAEDREIWEFARANGFTIVTQDSDYADMAALFGSPPYVLWLRCGNQPTAAIEKRLRDHADEIEALVDNPSLTCLEIL